jgi:DMSO/TMAO reductase YedYZ molybdopterin-dependent catalytic subunit
MADRDRRVLTELPVFQGTSPRAWPGLRIDGLVNAPVTLMVEDLRLLPTREFVQDFQCEEGWVAAGQRWRGVRLSDLLELCELDPSARHVSCSAGDFTVGLTIEEATVPETLLALRLQDRPLPPEHGGPCRLVVSGKPCFTSVKWVDRLTALADRPQETAEEIALKRIAEKSAGTGQGER